MFRLLIADDEYIEREAMKSIIMRKFADVYEIWEAKNGFQAVEEAKAFSPHLIFMDIKMPGCSGIEAAKQIREFLPDVNIVFITAYDYFDYAKEAIALRANELLLKPVEVDTVLELTETITQKIRKTEENRNYNKEMESKFEQITRRFQHEFMETLNNYNASKDTIEHYLKIMDISFLYAVAATVDFSQIEQDKSIGFMQKDFICTRFLSKIQTLSEQAGMACILGTVDNCTQIVFLISTLDKENRKELASEQILSEINDFIKHTKKRMNLDIDYKLSEVIQKAGELPMALYALNQASYVKSNTQVNKYPYDLEEKLILALEKQNFDDCRKFICEIAKTLRKEYSSHTFNREAMGLYAVVKRTLNKLSDYALMPHGDELSERIFNDSEMISFFHRLLSYAETVLEKKIDKNRILIQKICDYLDEHYNEDFSLEQAADMIGFSTFYFLKLMKEYLNMSYIDYLTSIRIRKAKELFDRTNKTVSEIAFEVGYTDANYFTRVFKRLEGITPSNYKTKNYHNYLE